MIGKRKDGKIPQSGGSWVTLESRVNDESRCGSGAEVGRWDHSDRIGRIPLDRSTTISADVGRDAVAGTTR